MSKTRNDQILDLWATGRSATLVASAVGVSRNSVIGVVFRARTFGDARAVQRRPSHDGSAPDGMAPAPFRVPIDTPAIDRVRSLASSGHTASEIALITGRSRNSVYLAARRGGIVLPRARSRQGEPLAVDVFMRRGSSPIPEEVA